MKGFLIAVLLIGGFVFFVYKNDPARAGSSSGGAGNLFSPQANGKVAKVTPSDYESKVVNSQGPVLAYFWAPW